MNKVIDKGFRSCRFVSIIVKHPVHRPGDYFDFTPSWPLHILQQIVPMDLHMCVKVPSLLWEQSNQSNILV